MSEALIEHHRALAAGGVGMTTVAYCAVTPDGRTFRDQLYIRTEVVPELRALTEAVHREGAAVSIQLGHCGAFSNNHDLMRRRPMGTSCVLNLVGALSGRVLADAMTEMDIEDVTGAFVSAARLAHASGFDAVELHLGHGYLLSQFLSPITSRDDLDTAMCEGFELVAMGRALIHDPSLIAKYAAGSARTSGCEPCNQCVAEMDRPGGVCCAKVPAQLSARKAYVSRR